MLFAAPFVIPAVCQLRKKGIVEPFKSAHWKAGVISGETELALPTHCCQSGNCARHLITVAAYA
jgi:hypothetical protein